MSQVQTIEQGSPSIDDGMENLFRLFGVLYEIDRENEMKDKATKV